MELLSDYRETVVRLALLEEGRESHLLFLSLEMLPLEVPAPPQGKWERQRVGSFKLLFRRFVLHTREAIDWWQSIAERAQPQLPPVRGLGDRTAVAPLHLSESAPLRLVVMTNVPFAADVNEDVRVGHLIASVDPPGVVMAATEFFRSNTPEWLTDRIHIDPFIHTEWLQGAALFAPNPLLRSLQIRMTPPDSDRAQAVLIKGERRVGADLSDLKLIVSEQTIEGTLRVVDLSFDAGGWAVLECPDGPEDVGIVLVCGARGVLAVRGPATFIKRVQVDMGVIGPRRRVKVPPTARRPGADVDSQNSHVERRGIGGFTPGARGRLLELRTRQTRRTGGEGQQLWFSSQAVAREQVLSLIGTARRHVVIVDPYLDAAVFLELSQKIWSNAVETRALVSLPYVRKKNALEGISAGTGPDAVGFDTAKTEGAELIEIAELVKTSRLLTNAQVRVMKQASSLHGRYLVVDDSVWLFSESFKAVGSSPGGAVRLPDPDAARAAIEAAWKNATDIAILARERRSEPGDPGDPVTS